MNDIKKLSLEFQHESAIAQIAEAEKMNWELWIESAESFSDLKKQLEKRGYKGMPMTDKPFLLGQGGYISEDILKKLPNQKTMMRKKSQLR